MGDEAYEINDNLPPKFDGGLGDVLLRRIHFIDIGSSDQLFIKNANSYVSKLLLGAEIRSVCTEAGMFAIRARRKVATEKDFLEAVNKVIKGYAKFSATPRYLTHN